MNTALQDNKLCYNLTATFVFHKTHNLFVVLRNAKDIIWKIIGRVKLVDILFHVRINIHAFYVINEAVGICIHEFTAIGIFYKHIVLMKIIY